MTDPFTAAASAILSALSASSSFSAIVAPGNLIDLSSDSFERFKSQLQFGDTPEVVLLPDGFELQPFGANSKVASLSQTFELIATHDSLRTATLNALKFAVMTALLKSGTELGLGSLVRSWEIHKGRDDFEGHSSWRRGAQRWVSLMSITVHMELDRSQLLASQ
jgi:hypothetical protein